MKIGMLTACIKHARKKLVRTAISAALPVRKYHPQVWKGAIVEI